MQYQRNQFILKAIEASAQIIVNLSENLPDDKKRANLDIAHELNAARIQLHDDPLFSQDLVLQNLISKAEKKGIRLGHDLKNIIEWGLAEYIVTEMSCFEKTDKSIEEPDAVA